MWGNAVDVAEELEALDHREVPPELGALAEDRADARDVADAVAPGDEAADLAVAAGGLEDAAEDFEGRRLAGGVRTDEAEELALGEGEADSFSASMVRERRRTRPVSAPRAPGWRSATRKDFVRWSTTIWGADMMGRDGGRG